MGILASVCAVYLALPDLQEPRGTGSIFYFTKPLQQSVSIIKHEAQALHIGSQLCSDHNSAPIVKLAGSASAKCIFYTYYNM